MNISLLVLIVISVGCSTSESVPANAFVGTWRLTTYCKPTGSSTCVATSVPTDKGVFITFDNNGQYSETYQNTTPADYRFLNGSGTYTVEGNDLRIRTFVMSSTAGQLVKVVAVNTTLLVLNPYGNGNYTFVK